MGTVRVEGRALRRAEDRHAHGRRRRARRAARQVPPLARRRRVGGPRATADPAGAARPQRARTAARGARAALSAARASRAPIGVRRAGAAALDVRSAHGSRAALPRPAQGPAPGRLRSRRQGRPRQGSVGVAARGRPGATRRAPGAPLRRGPAGAAGRLPGDGRRRQGRDDRARDERREPAGRARDLVQAADRGSSSRTTSCGAARPRCRHAARSGSSTARTTRRCSSCACTPSTWPARGSILRSARSERFWKARLDRHRRLGAAPQRERHADRQVLPQRLTRGAAQALPVARIASTSKHWKFSAADVRERAHWDAYQDGLRGGAVGDEHRRRAVVRDPGRPQVADAHRRRIDHRPPPRGDGPAVPGADAEERAAMDEAAARCTRRLTPPAPASHRRTQRASVD